MKHQRFAGRNGRIELVLALIGGALVLALAVGSSALAGGGNSANAKLCQEDGWIGLMQTNGSTFANDGACVSYAAQGGRLVPFTGCFVLDTSKPANFSTSSLGAVVTGATGGDALTVQGACTGTTTIDRSLTVTGQSSPGYSTPTLQGPAEHVLVVDSGTVTLLNTLTITGGHTLPGVGGGIWNMGGDLTLNSCTVSGNSSRNGGGIYNAGGGTLTLDGNTSITGNHSETPVSTPNVGGEGGGITNLGTLILNDSASVSNNASGAGGGLFELGGSVTLNDNSSIHDNTASTVDGRGGGIFVGSDGVTTTLNGSSSIYDNTAANGGGVFNWCGSSLILNDESSITGNTATLALGGGGIFNAGVLTPGDGGSHVHDNYSPSAPTINNIVSGPCV
jgi:hypothetical protein